MKTINHVFLILLLNLAASPLFAQNNLSIGSTQIGTFVKKVNGAGDLTAAVQAADGDYVTASRINHRSYLVMKMNASGQKKWQRKLNFDVDEYFVSINGIAQTTDGGFILAGYVGCRSYWECPINMEMSRAILIKLREDGTAAWKKGFVEPLGVIASQWGAFFSSVIPVSDGGVIAIGAHFSSPYFFVRVTATGKIVWKKHFGKLCGAFPCVPSLIHSTSTPDHGFIAVLKGVDTLHAQIPTVDFLKITDLGNVVWRKRIASRGFASLSVGPTEDGGVILAGTGSNSKLKVAVLKADGTLEWKAGYFLKSPVETSGSVLTAIQTADGGYWVTGTTKPGKAFIAKIDSSRNVVYQNIFVGQSVRAAFATADGGSLLFGSRAIGDNRPDLLVLKVNSEGIADGCDFFRSLGGSIPSSFGRLRIRNTNTTEEDVESLDSIDFGLTSGVSKNRISSVCQ